MLKWSLITCNRIPNWVGVVPAPVSEELTINLKPTYLVMKKPKMTFIHIFWFTECINWHVGTVSTQHRANANVLLSRWMFNTLPQLVKLIRIMKSYWKQVVESRVLKAEYLNFPTRGKMQIGLPIWKELWMLSCQRRCVLLCCHVTVGDLIQIFQFLGSMKLTQLISNCEKVDKKKTL